MLSAWHLFSICFKFSGFKGRFAGKTADSIKIAANVQMAIFNQQEVTGR